MTWKFFLVMTTVSSGVKELSKKALPKPRINRIYSYGLLFMEIYRGFFPLSWRLRPKSSQVKEAPFTRPCNMNPSIYRNKPISVLDIMSVKSSVTRPPALCRPHSVECESKQSINFWLKGLHNKVLLYGPTNEIESTLNGKGKVYPFHIFAASWGLE